MAITFVMEQLDFEVHQASNGFQAVQMVKALNYEHAANTYTLIMMDLNMPLIDGYEACKRIKKFFLENSRMPISYGLEDKKVQLDRINFMPIIAACTSENTKIPSVAERIEDAGFDITFEAPVTKNSVEQ